MKGLTREKLDAIIAQQRAALRAKFGEDTEFRFRVQIEGGKTRLKASRVKIVGRIRPALSRASTARARLASCDSNDARGTATFWRSSLLRSRRRVDAA